MSVLNRAFTVFRFSPQLALIHEARTTNAQALDFDRNVADAGDVGGVASF